MKERKLPNGIKNKGYRNAPYEKMPDKAGNGSEKYAPCHSDGAGKKVPSEHVGPGEMSPEKVKQK